MDWRERLITLFSWIERRYELGLFIYSERMSNNFRPDFSDSEVLTVYLWGIMNGHSKVSRIYEYVRNHLSEWFPKLFAYATLRCCPRFRMIFLCLIDSMPIMTANAQRSDRAKVARELTDKGWSSSKKT